MEQIIGNIRVLVQHQVRDEEILRQGVEMAHVMEVQLSSNRYFSRWENIPEVYLRRDRNCLSLLYLSETFRRENQNNREAYYTASYGRTGIFMKIAMFRTV